MQCSHTTVNRVKNTLSERDRNNEYGNRFKSSVHSVFRFADPANVVKSFLDRNKDHLLNQARSELVKQEHQVGTLNKCIDELQQQAHAQRLELEDAHHGFFRNSKRTISTTRRIIYEGKSAARNSNTKNARDGRNEESSRITSRRLLFTKIKRKS